MKCLRNANEFIRNANEFKREISKIRSFYIEKCQPSIIKNRAKFVDNPTNKVPEEAEALLEAHMRRYYIDAFLKALNWQFDSLSNENLLNLIQEFPVQSVSENKTRFLDYLGMDEVLERAMLIVETKRPGSKLPLPKRNKSGNPPKGETFESLISSSLSGNTELTEEWQEWLETLRDYTKSIKAKSNYYPKRVVITNGDWLIIFLNPEDAFNSINPRHNEIEVYQTWDVLEEKSHEIFGFLEYYEILSRVPSLSLGEIGFYLRPEIVDKAMFGLLLTYQKEAIRYLDFPAPIIRVTPVVLLRSKGGVWFRIETENPEHEQPIPKKQHLLEAHLTLIDDIAKNLLDKINLKMGLTISCSSLTEHYSENDLFEELSTVIPIKNISREYEEFLVVTGNNTHYLLKEPTILNCPYHSWNNAKSEGFAFGIAPIEYPTINSPRTIFINNLDYHCSHRDIMKAKSCPITLENRDRCGSRSSGEQGAFCEIWRFEQHLCCRTCAFEEVCTKAEVFQGLPCKDGSTPV